MSGLYEFLMGMKAAYRFLREAPPEDKKRIKEIAMKIGEEFDKILQKHFQVDDPKELADRVIALYFCLVGMGSCLIRDLEFDGKDFMDASFEFFLTCLQEKGISVPDGLSQLREATLSEWMRSQGPKVRKEDKDVI